MDDQAFAIAFLINGTQVDPSTLTDEDELARIDAIVEMLAKGAAGTVCPDHSEPPRFLFSGPNFDSLSMEIMGCCQKVVDLAKKKLAE